MSDFQSTLWSVVLRAKDPPALNRLCETYWEPVYVYVRRKGHPPEDAQDRTQGFFAHLLEKGILERVEKRGRFRNFLITVLEHYLANEYRREHAAKRTRDVAAMESRIREAESPEEALRRAWSLAGLQQAFAALKREFEEKGLPGHFEAVRGHLSAGARPSYQELAVRLGCSVSDDTNLLHRSRRRLQSNIREILRETVDSEAELESEIRDLFP